MRLRRTGMLGRLCMRGMRGMRGVRGMRGMRGMFGMRGMRVMFDMLGMLVMFGMLAACTLGSPSTPLAVRYFAPDLGEPVPVPAAPHAACPRIALGRITASDHLRYRIAWRRSPVELELSDTLRWAERPEDYARRAIERALFGVHAFPRALADGAPTLDVEVTAFEAVETTPTLRGRVELRYTVAAEHDVTASGAIRVERAVAPGRRVDDLVPALGEALTAAADELATRLCRR